MSAISEANSRSPLGHTHAEAHEALRTIDPLIKDLILTHRENSKRWMPHEVVPWGQGECFIDKPWDQSQCKLRPEIVSVLETNLLTEDNLPYYHAAIERVVEPGSSLGEWNRLWTAEEGAHATAIRDYMYLTRAMDPNVLEQNRLMVMEAGFDRAFNGPLEVFAYTAPQELATRISHLAVGQKSDDPILLKLLSLVARDENFHYIFYRSVVKAILDIAPHLMLPAIMKQLYSFAMPGDGMENFAERSSIYETERIFGVREYRDFVVKPILGHWKIDRITGLTPETQKVQERILKLELVLDRMVERAEARASSVMLKKAEETTTTLKGLLEN